MSEQLTANPRMPHDLWASAIELERKIVLKKTNTFFDSVSQLANFMVFYFQFDIAHSTRKMPTTNDGYSGNIYESIEMNFRFMGDFMGRRKNLEVVFCVLSACRAISLQISRIDKRATFNRRRSEPTRIMIIIDTKAKIIRV